jgi:hypothetical protein
VTAANAIMTLRTMVFPPFAASTDSIRVSLVVDAYRPRGSSWRLRRGLAATALSTGQL